MILDERPSGPPKVRFLDLSDHDLRVTNPTGASNTHGADDGRVGWKRHAVRKGERRSVCGLLPRNGWGMDLFEEGMALCWPCARALGACKRCRGSRFIDVRTEPHHWRGERCPACGPPRPDQLPIIEVTRMTYERLASGLGDMTGVDTSRASGLEHGSYVRVKTRSDDREMTVMVKDARKLAERPGRTLLTLEDAT